MSDTEVNELATICGLSSEEYESILNSFKKSQNDLSIETMVLEDEITPASSSRLLTGIPEIDEITKGLKVGVNVIAGFLKCGKTTLALNLVYKALNDGLNICMLSLEMLKTDVLNILISLHTFELDPATAVTREELSMMYQLDKDRYTSYFNSFLSLSGDLIIFTERDIRKNAHGGPTYSEQNLNDLFDKTNKSCYEKTGRPVEMLVIDNLNCIRLWGKKTTGEPAYTAASDYFRQVSLNFGTRVENEEENVAYGEQPVICLLLAQINRAGGKAAEFEQFYPKSCIAETVNVERDASAILAIYTNETYLEDNIVRVKLEETRFSKPMLSPVDIPTNLSYGKIGYPIGKININEEKLNRLRLRDKYRLVMVISMNSKSIHKIPKKIILPKNAPVPAGYREVDEDYNSNEIII